MSGMFFEIQCIFLHFWYIPYMQNFPREKFLKNLRGEVERYNSAFLIYFMHILFLI